MPKLVRLYIRHVLIGFGLSAIFVAALLWLNVVGLRDLIFGSSAGYLAGVMLFMGNGIIFSGAQFAITILLMADDDDDPKGGKRESLKTFAPAPVHIEK